jgi:hypothetical protein
MTTWHTSLTASFRMSPRTVGGEVHHTIPQETLEIKHNSQTIRATMSNVQMAKSNAMVVTKAI